MPVYRYQAVGQGRRSTGFLTADTPAEGRRILRKRGLQVTRFLIQDSDAEPARFWSLARLGMRPKQDAVDEFTHYLAMLLRAGVPLAEALTVLVRQVPRNVEPIVRRLSERVKAGTDLAQALTDENGLFDSTYIGIVRIGQASGMLETCLDRLVRLRRRQRLLRQRVRTALAYPTVVAVVGLVVVLFLMTFVVPRITEVLTQTGRALPLPTKILLAISDTIIGYWWLVPVLAIAVTVGLRTLDRQRRIGVWIKGQMLRIPLLGAVLMKAGIAQISTMLETMLRSGLPLDEAISISGAATSNALLKNELGKMLEALRSGHPLIDSSQRRGVLPPVVRHMLSVGEQTGQLEESLAELSAFYDAEVEIASRRVISLLEPALIVVMSCIVGFIVLATLLPILRLSGSL